LTESSQTAEPLDGVMLLMGLRQLWRCWQDRCRRTTDETERKVYETAMAEIEALIKQSRDLVWPALRQDLARAVAHEIASLSDDPPHRQH
jgi:hypothetical protein